MKDQNPKTGLDIIVETKLGDDNFYEIIVKYSTNTESFKLRPLTYLNFEVKLKQAIKDVIEATQIDEIGLKTKIPNDNIIEKNIPYVFTQIVSYHNTEEEKPVVATIYLKSSDIPVFYGDNSLFEKTKDTLLNTIKKVSVEISFYGGFIEKIQLQGTIKDIPLTFNNKYSIGISSTKNIQQLSGYRLFSDNIFTDIELSNLSKTDTLSNSKENQEYSNNGKRLRINVSDIIRYVKKVDVNANDVSPVPQLLILDRNQTESKLYREETSKLFEAAVYSDFLGLFNEDNPNGIIQTEINKRFNINTKRTDVNKWFGLLFPPLAISEGIGVFQFFDANFQYSKIESDSKFVVPNLFNVLDDSGAIIESVNYYSPISLLQRRNFSIGGNLNILTLENQNSKLNMYLNAGFLFGRTALKNDINDIEGFYTNNLEIPIEYIFHILPERRVSFSFSDRLSWFETFDSNINLKSIEDNLLSSKNRWLNSFNIDLNVDLSSTGRLFLRYKLTHEWDNINNNFSRFQFGYSFYLLKNNGVKTKLN
ncbi:hypothetical protein [Olleya sp. HaHaR_3_96]|uniref:hypothetical protein n=1 Tax=Olleya sp. HaHaR_3_96 TaxID=2745560 RepID=UPI001C4F38E8|nr:hypothetical protein [Olleya sp. HaHaR_3_96]QXP60049.1 hypothetical protein H0I26_19420 [Olleya sp. HaHaR_3_96]